MWTDPGWFNYQLEVRIWFWSSPARPKTSCTWAFPLCILVLYGELMPSSFLNYMSPPLSNKPPPFLLNPASNGLQINKPPGALIEGLRLFSCEQVLGFKKRTQIAWHRSFAEPFFQYWFKGKRKVMRINKMITNEKMLWSFIQFSQILKKCMVISVENWYVDIELMGLVALLGVINRINPIIEGRKLKFKALTYIVASFILGLFSAASNLCCT